MPPVSPITGGDAMRGRSYPNCGGVSRADGRVLTGALALPYRRRMRRVRLSSGETVPVRITLPDAASPGRTPAVVLAPGAGSSMESPLLIASGRHLAAAGYVVATFDFPYRAAGRRVPDRAPVLIDCWQAVLDAIVGDDTLAPPWVVVGGRSMGGRMASLWLAEGHRSADLVRGLLLLGYPLHPAGDPTRLRSAHLPRVHVPA